MGGEALLLDLDSYGGNNPLGMFPLFLMRTADVLAPHLAMAFRLLLRLGSSAVRWRVANITPIPKGPLPPQWPIITDCQIHLAARSGFVGLCQKSLKLNQKMKLRYS